VTTYIEPQLQSLVAQLLARYPGVRIVRASLHHRVGAEAIAQEIRFQAPLEVLRGSGLVTSAMLGPATAAHGSWGTLETGDQYGLYPALDSLSTPGSWDLVWVASTHLEDKRRFSMKGAAKVLGRISQAARTAV
jgi:hypothetical protein